MKKFLSHFFFTGQNPLHPAHAGGKNPMEKQNRLAGNALLLLEADSSQAGKWTLVWSDEFNHKGLPDPAKWGDEEGFVRNHESQYYTMGRLENARVEHGHLVIEGRKGHYTPAITRRVNTPRPA